MKNVKFIAVALMASMMLMGAGYAALGWTDTTTYTATVETGNLDVQIAGVVPAIASAGPLTYTQGQMINGAGPIVPGPSVNTAHSVHAATPIISSDKKSVTFDFTNAFPGATLLTQITVKNTGSIPVKLDTFDWTVVDPDLDAYLTSDFGGNGHFNGALPGNILGFVDPNDLKNAVLDVGDTITLNLTATVKDNAPENTNGQYRATFNWKQFNQ